MSVKVSYSSSINPSNPKTDGVVVIGKQDHLNQLKDFPDVLKPKFGDVINDQVGLILQLTVKLYNAKPL